MTNKQTLEMTAAYTLWADDVMLRNAAKAGVAAAEAPRETLFGSIAGTFDHILVVAEIFDAHLHGRRHGHEARRRTSPLPFDEAAERLRDIDANMLRYARGLSAENAQETVRFEFVGGGAGAMTRGEILLHLANHAAYHRGFVSTLLFPLVGDIAPTDLTVFLRDVWSSDTKDGPAPA